MRERVDQLGVAEPEIQRSGADQIDVSLPDVKNADEAANQVGTTAQMYFYDWETNVLDANCKTGADRPERDGRLVGGDRRRRDGLLHGGHAREQVPAAHVPEPARRTGSSTWSTRRPRRSSRARTRRARTSSRSSRTRASSRPSTQKTVEVKPGTIVVRAQSPDDKTKSTASTTSCRTSPALSGTDIKNPEQNFDNGAGGSGQPIVTFDFTDKGRSQWQKTTRAIAQRGSQSLHPGQRPARPRSSTSRSCSTTS